MGGLDHAFFCPDTEEDNSTSAPKMNLESPGKRRILLLLRKRMEVEMEWD